MKVAIKKKDIVDFSNRIMVAKAMGPTFGNGITNIHTMVLRQAQQ